MEWFQQMTHSEVMQCYKLPSIYVFSYFPFYFEGRMWDLIVSVPDHCLSFYFICTQSIIDLLEPDFGMSC